MPLSGGVNIVLDDDPTGVQAVRDVPVLLDWSAERLRHALASGRPSVHLMTNVRALAAADAEAVTFAAASSARQIVPQARIVLRGDSTLRGYLHEEYRAVSRAAYPERPPVLLLVPALPAAGRVTIDGVQWLVTDGVRSPLSETEYARDGSFAYRSARLLEWAEERSRGEIRAADGTELPLGRLRDEGAAAVCEAILDAGASGRPAACAPDAETLDDMGVIVQGLAAAEGNGVPVLVRCAPTFAGVLAGTLAQGWVPAPRPRTGGLVIVCGSYVSGTTEQLEHLRGALGMEAIEADVRGLLGDASAEVSRLAVAARARLVDRGIALVSTPRERPADLTALDAGQRIAEGLGAAVAALDPLPEVVIAKGGITSQVVLTHGLGAYEGRVVGPVVPGVALWEVESRGRKVDYLVFPGNVGGPDHLTRLVRLVTDT